jgi:hypothetical protein
MVNKFASLIRDTLTRKIEKSTQSKVHTGCSVLQDEIAKTGLDADVVVFRTSQYLIACVTIKSGRFTDVRALRSLEHMLLKVVKYESGIVINRIFWSSVASQPNNDMKSANDTKINRLDDDLLSSPDDIVVDQISYESLQEMETQMKELLGLG